MWTHITTFITLYVMGISLSGRIVRTLC